MKYFSVASPGILMLLGLAIAAIRPVVVRLLLIASLLGASAPALAGYYRHSHAALDQAAHYVKTRATQNSLVFVGSGLQVFSYYYINEFPRLGSAIYAGAPE